MTLRVMPEAMVRAFESGRAAMQLLAELQFDSATVRATNIPYSVQWGGFEWSGLGQFVGIGDLTEGAALQAQDLTLTLSGLPVAAIALALAENIVRRPFVLYVAALNPDTHQIIDAVPLWGGRMDQMVISRDAETATIALRVQTEMVDWATPVGGRYNDADQQARFPGDRGLEFVAQMVEKELVWPAASFYRQPR